jgi:hypothetical protein
LDLPHLAVRLDHRRGSFCVPEGIRVLTVPVLGPV